MKIYSNFIMKTLKNKLLIGAVATLGFFGNADAQNSENQHKEYQVYYSINNNYNETYSIEKSLILKDGEKYLLTLRYLINKETKDFVVILGHRTEELRACQDIEKIVEFFTVHNNLGLIDYSQIDYCKSPPEVLYRGKKLTKDELENRFEEAFVRRTKEIFDSRKDSLSMINLAKKEYELGKLINNEVKIEKVAKKFY
ncbi:MAG: hypothetical protein QT10_C0012G0010 [archaeon GW2011_AR19]|nr:MAG: hypothetical protein QT10_C0012G0010 [archaeon GW2011_AR19]